MTHIFRHPKHYKEMRVERRKHQAASDKQQATSCSKDPDLPSHPQIQAASDKHQAPSIKLQATSRKRQAAR